ncbi:hypothetical protein [Rhodoferax sp.]|uniref:hypothetical protein n=1 Tax=Rhodoferax sp. TaxID=50421 RepID=UPI001ED6E7BF|nr:hypothetical protein [Rhodoferax sp.]MBT9507702.1 hypothetical protein [Rhodoferax sp.]
MNFPAHIEKALTDVELCSTEVSSALVSGEPLALVSASAALRQAALDFSQLLQDITQVDLKSKNLKLRLKRIADIMAFQRESLIRRTVLVERALNAMVPATQSTTYAQVAGPYGSPGKQTGAFKLLSA